MVIICFHSGLSANLRCPLRLLSTRVVPVTTAKKCVQAWPDYGFSDTVTKDPHDVERPAMDSHRPDPCNDLGCRCEKWLPLHILAQTCIKMRSLDSVAMGG